MVMLKLDNFSQFLSADEFQELCCDYIQIKENREFETFVAQDGGIDARCQKEGQTIIMQAKHYSNYNNLKSELKGKELKKIQKLHPDRYILIVSMGLTLKRKSDLLDIFKDYIHSPNDLITGTDIAKDLRNSKYQKVAEYYRQKLLRLLQTEKNYIDQNEDLFVHCKGLYQEIQRLKSYYIETESFREAFQVLQKNRIVLLTGDPGAGKTTNAKMLIEKLISNESFDEVRVLSNSSQFLEYYDGSRKQIFLLDDFWGSTFLNQKFSGREEHNLETMFSYVAKETKTYLILTSREYVLKQGLEFFQGFHSKYINERIVHSNAKLSKLEKTKILLSHAIASNLNWDILLSLGYQAKEIIEERNYSPRVVSFYLENNQDGQNSSDFLNSFRKYLQNPSDYFSNVFYKLSEGARITAYLIAISDPPVILNRLYQTFLEVKQNDPRQEFKASQFNTYIEELENTFTDFNVKESTLDFKNPSIHDFIMNRFEKEFPDYEQILSQSVLYFDQYIALLQNDRIKLRRQTVLTLLQRLQNEFNTMDIASLDGIDMDMMFRNPDDPISWMSAKLWHSFNVYDKYKEKNFGEFLVQTVFSLLNYYERRNHFYEDQLFRTFPELLKRIENIGYGLNWQELSKSYLRGCKYLFELHSIQYGSLSFQKECQKHFFDIYGEDFLEYLKEKLEWELEELSEDGITLEYNLTIEELPSILKFFHFPMTKKIRNVLRKYEYTLDPVPNLKKENKLEQPQKRNPEEQEIDDYIEKIHTTLWGERLQEQEFLNLIRQSSLDEKMKTKIEKSSKEQQSIFALSEETTKDYVNFVIQYLTESGKRELDWAVFPNLVQYIFLKIQTLDKNFLLQYAHDTYFNQEYLLQIELVKKYQVTEQEIEQLLALGVFYSAYHRICFSDHLFHLYLVVMQERQQPHKSYQQYCDFMEARTICSRFDYLMFEYFDTKDFNQLFLYPVFQSIVEPMEKYTLKKLIHHLIGLKIEIDEDNGFTWQSESDYSSLDEFFFSFFGVSMIENISSKIYEKWKMKDIAVPLRQYLKNWNPKDLDEIQEKLEIYYGLILKIYRQLLTSLSGEKLHLQLDDGTIVF